MALLHVPDIRRIFRLGKSRSPLDDAPPVEVATRDAAADPAGAEPAGPSATVEPKLTVPASRSRSIAELQRSYDQVMTLVGRIGDHLDEQSERQARIDEVVGRLPAALEVLPQISRQNERMLELLGSHLEQASEREQSLSDALDRLDGSSRQQTEVLGLLHQQLQSSAETSRVMTDALGDFRTTLGDLGESNRRTVDVLADMAAAADRRESKLEMILGRTQKWMIAALLCCGAAAVTALVIALV